MRGRLIVGIVLVGIAAVWIASLRGFELFPGGWSTWWPSVLIAIALLQLVLTPRDFGGALVLLAIGGVLQAWRLDALPEGWTDYVLPAFLGLIGIIVLVSIAVKPKQPAWRERAREDWKRQHGNQGDVAIFSEVTHDEGEREYRGGELTSVFGSLHADLRRAKLAPEGAHLKATSVFGSMDVRVPPEWRVEVHGVPVFGSTKNATAPRAEGPVLRVEAVSVFGNVDVAN